MLAVQVLNHVAGLHFKIDLRAIINLAVDIEPLRLFLCVSRS